MKDYLNFEGLSHFLTQLLSLFVKKEDIVTEEEIDTICGMDMENIVKSVLPIYNGEVESV